MISLLCLPFFLATVILVVLVLAKVIKLSWWLVFLPFMAVIYVGLAFIVNGGLQ